MKKTYQNPETRVVKLSCHAIMQTASQTIGFGSGTKTVGDAASRGSRNWFDDEDED